MFAIFLAGLFFLRASDKRNRADGALLTEGASELLDGLFNGRPVVTYQSTTRTLRPATVIEGAGERGYELISNTAMPYGDLIEGRDLVFSKRG